MLTKKSEARPKPTDQKRMLVPNESVLSDAEVSRENIQDLSTSTIDTQPRNQKQGNKSFLNKLWSRVKGPSKQIQLDSLEFPKDTEQSGLVSPVSPYRKSVQHNAKKEADENQMRFAKRLLRDLHELKKEETILQMVEAREIETEEEAQAVEDQMDKDYIEEYGSYQNSDFEDDIMGGDSDNEEHHKFNTESFSKESVKEASEIQKTPNPLDSTKSKQKASENSPQRGNFFSIDEMGDEKDHHHHHHHNNLNLHHLPREAAEDDAEKMLEGTPTELIEVYYNKIPINSSDHEPIVHRYYSREEHINLKKFNVYEANRNVFASLLANLIRRDIRHVFIHERTFYITKKLEGNFATVEAAYPLSRLSKIHIHDSAHVLKFSFIDDEAPGFAHTEERFQIKNCNDLVMEIQKNLQGVNSSIRIDQSGETFE